MRAVPHKEGWRPGGGDLTANAAAIRVPDSPGAELILVGFLAIVWHSTRSTFIKLLPRWLVTYTAR